MNETESEFGFEAVFGFESGSESVFESESESGFGFGFESES